MIREEKTTKGWLIIRLTQTKWWAVWWSNGQRSCLLPDDPSSNPAEAYIYYVKIAFEKDKYKQKEAGVGTLKNPNSSQVFVVNSQSEVYLTASSDVLNSDGRIVT